MVLISKHRLGNTGLRVSGPGRASQKGAFMAVDATIWSDYPQPLLGLSLALSTLIRAVMWQFANKVTPCMGSTLSGGRGNRDRPRERFTIFSVLPAMDRKQQQAEKVQYVHTATINTLHFFLAPLPFHASVIPPSLIFNISSPNLDPIVLATSSKEHRAFPPGAQHHAEALSPCRFSSFFLLFCA